VDSVNRRLYYTNIGSVTVDNKQYSWHKVETVRIGSTSPLRVRTIVSSYADRPRAIAVDSSKGYASFVLHAARRSLSLFRFFCRGCRSIDTSWRSSGSSCWDLIIVLLIQRLKALINF